MVCDAAKKIEAIKGYIKNNYAFRLVFRSAKVLIGEFVCAVGIVATINAGIGLAPSVVFYQGISFVTPLTIGQASILTSLIIIFALIGLKENLGLGTLYDMTAAGIFLDLLIKWDIIPKAKGVISGVLLLCVGLFIIAFGCFIYMKEGLGAGPKDALMVALSKKNRFSSGMNRVIIEGSFCLFGWLMGGAVGLGTIISAFGLGTAMQLVFKALHFNVSSIQQETLSETWSGLKKTISRITSDKEEKKREPDGSADEEHSAVNT